MSTPNPAVEPIYATGRWLVDEGRHEDAMHVFRALMMAAPADERAWLGLGICHESVGQARTAIALYAMGAQVGASVRCHVARARALRSIDDAEGAKAALDDASSLAEGLHDDDVEALLEAERNPAR